MYSDSILYWFLFVISHGHAFVAPVHSSYHHPAAHPMPTHDASSARHSPGHVQRSSTSLNETLQPPRYSVPDAVPPSEIPARSTSDPTPNSSTEETSVTSERPPHSSQEVDTSTLTPPPPLPTAEAFKSSKFATNQQSSNPVGPPPSVRLPDGIDLKYPPYKANQSFAPNPLDSVPSNGTDPSGCRRYEPCNLFYQFVHVYFWPVTDGQAPCAHQAPMDDSKPPPDMPMKSPSIYAIFPSIMASDGCQTIGGTYKDITTSFAPGQLSTLEVIDGVQQTRVFDPAELACPPARIKLAPGQKYEPLIAPPEFVTVLDSNFAGCVPALSQGVDPPHAVQTANSVDGPGKGRIRGARNFIPRVAAIPIQTAMPS